ncbi:MAG: threonine synthase [Anaerolineae bacterium]
MAYIHGLRCRECGETYEEGPIYICEECFGPLEVVYDYHAIGRDVQRRHIVDGPFNIWRYQALLPAQSNGVVGSDVGFTPLFHARNLGRVLGLDQLYIKNDCVTPSYSFKDRVVSIAVTKALEFGFDTIACASTGNLANSVAAQAARAGLRAVVFVPADLEEAKIAASLVYGPTVMAVDGNYDDVNRLCSILADQKGWAFVNVNMRPYYSEGAKTLGFEVAEQLGWRAPDHIVVPMASGSLLVKIKKGLDEFARVGLIDGISTRVSGAQPAGCSPIATAFEEGAEQVYPVVPDTIAKSLAIGVPADGPYALRAIRGSNGAAAAATDDEVIEGIRLLAETEGILAETAGGVTVAVLKKLAERGTIRPDELTVAYITGNGLKTQVVLNGRLAEPHQVTPTIAAVEAALERQAMQAVKGEVVGS